MIPGTATRVPAVLARLLELFAADDVLGADDVALYDGAPLKDPDAADVVVLAPSTPDSPGITVSYELQNGLGRNVYEERVELLVTISCWDGDDEDGAMAERRARVLALYGALCAVLRAEQVAQGVWDAIGLGEVAEWFLVPSQTGCTVALGFTIVTRAVL